jgi:hypothetical protein
MSIMDENEETMAHLNMKVNEGRKSQEEDEADPVLESHAAAHWKLSSANARITSTRIKTLNRTDLLYCDFNMRLWEYLADNYPNHPVSYEQDIQVCILLHILGFLLT